jgi:hypothetical protein
MDSKSKSLVLHRASKGIPLLGYLIFLFTWTRCLGSDQCWQERTIWNGFKLQLSLSILALYSLRILLFGKDTGSETLFFGHARTIRRVDSRHGIIIRDATAASKDTLALVSSNNSSGRSISCTVRD